MVSEFSTFPRNLTNIGSKRKENSSRNRTAVKMPCSSFSPETPTMSNSWIKDPSTCSFSLRPPWRSLEWVGRRPLSNCLSPSLALLKQFSFPGYEKKNPMRITDIDSSAHLGLKNLYFQPFVFLTDGSDVPTNFGMNENSLWYTALGW